MSLCNSQPCCLCNWLRLGIAAPTPPLPVTSAIPSVCAPSHFCFQVLSPLAGEAIPAHGMGAAFFPRMHGDGNRHREGLLALGDSPRAVRMALLALICGNSCMLSQKRPPKSNLLLCSGETLSLLPCQGFVLPKSEGVRAGRDLRRAAGPALCWNRAGVSPSSLMVVFHGFQHQFFSFF